MVELAESQARIAITSLDDAWAAGFDLMGEFAVGLTASFGAGGKVADLFQSAHVAERAALLEIGGAVWTVSDQVVDYLRWGDLDGSSISGGRVHIVSAEVVVHYQIIFIRFVFSRIVVNCLRDWEGTIFIIIVVDNTREFRERHCGLGMSTSRVVDAELSLVGDL